MNPTINSITSTPSQRLNNLPWSKSNANTPTSTIVEDSELRSQPMSAKKANPPRDKENLAREGQAVDTDNQSGDSGRTIVVDWEGPNDPQNPKNWSFRRKWAATTIVSAFTFISPVSSSMVAPATETIAAQFGITNDVLIAMTTSIFVLAYAIGPLILGPLSEIYGRSRVLQAANMFYLVWNLACGFAQNTAQLLVFRFLAGLGGSAPLSIGGGVLGDVWHPEERGKAIAVYSLAPLLGPVLGPIAGAWIADKSGGGAGDGGGIGDQSNMWRWVFWSTTIVDAAIQVAGMFWLQETFAPILLERKADKIRKEISGDPEKEGSVDVKTVYSNQEGRTMKEIIQKSLTRPFALFAREPIAQIIGLYMAFVYGVFYLFLTTIPTIFTEVYHESPGIGGLNYIGLGIGLTLSSQLNARYMDKIYVYLKNKNNGVGQPEFRVPAMFLGSFCLPAGLLISGWAAEEGVSWVVTDLGMIFVAAGVILTFQSMQTYVVDCFTLHAASALASISCLRSLAGFGFPLFAPAMYNAIGFGKGDTILAAVSIAVGWPAPIIFWKYGKAIRMKSKYARN
ncbi:MFS polyamine transporter [Lentinula detonsa]|uniref:MFS polyamine transporter n=1 Tax=Lentinula detonsa TaxID=2804962 RepID=A0AA38PSS8_9AGAR|nr:MFS polyamine transporter [Lentinula detonsa]